MKNKKVFKFQRKQILISNPLQPQQSQPQPHPHPHHPQKPPEPHGPNYPILQPNTSTADKLQIPKQLRLDNVVNRLKNKFVAMMDADPLIRVDDMFENEVVCRITGNLSKNNRDSFGNNKDKHHITTFDDTDHPERHDQSTTIFQPICQSQPNYLDLLQQGIAQNSLPLKQAFEQQPKILFKQRNRQWDPHEQHNKMEYFQESDYSLQFQRPQFDKNHKINMNRRDRRGRNTRNAQQRGFDRFQFS